ncbi:MAG: hypothetical protein KF901_27990 [Myxococcales bacterium]|nr:hypothetical protein [Myxococcales bacterium]
MTDTPERRTAKLTKGALVQLTEGALGVSANVVVFQYNPEKLSRTLTPWNPFETEGDGRGGVSPGVQPFDPKERLQLEVELDAADGLEEGHALAVAFGVSDRIAAIEALLWPSAGLLGDLVNAGADLLGQGLPVERRSVPLVLLVWGPGRIVPVRVTEYAIEEQLFSPLLFPLQAKISLTLEVVTPAAFGCEHGAAAELSRAAYRLHRLTQSSLAVAHFGSNLDALRSLLST